MGLKKGQAWGFDLILASMIFIFAILGFYMFVFNYSVDGEETFNNLIYEGQLVADSLLGEGHPIDWNETNVVTIGIMSENKINETKLNRFYNLTINDYDKTKRLFNVKYDYYINFSKPVYIGGSYQYIMGQQNSNPKNLIRISRFSIYDNTPITMNINIWAD